MKTTAFDPLKIRWIAPYPAPESWQWLAPVPTRHQPQRHQAEGETNSQNGGFWRSHSLRNTLLSPFSPSSGFFSLFKGPQFLFSLLPSF